MRGVSIRIASRSPPWSQFERRLAACSTVRHGTSRRGSHPSVRAEVEIILTVRNTFRHGPDLFAVVAGVIRSPLENDVVIESGGEEMGGCIGKPSTSCDHRYADDGGYSAAEAEADHATESPRRSVGDLSELRELGRASPAGARFAPSGDYAYHPSQGMAPQWSSGYVADTAVSPEREMHAARTAPSDGECQLGGYLVDRLILGRPVEGSALEKLRSANQTVSETRRALKYGRGNVSVDVMDSGGASSLRTEAGRLAKRAIPQKSASGEPLDPAVRAVAAAMTAQAGMCGEHAHVAGFLHAAKLDEGERVYVMGSSNPSHNWVEWRGETSDRRQGIVMDAWGKTSTILAEDGSLSHAGHHAEVDHHYDRATGAHAHAQLLELQNQRQWRMDAELGRQMNKLGPNFGTRNRRSGSRHQSCPMSSRRALRTQ